MERQDLYQKDLTKYTITGWIIYKTGVYHVNYGGGIEYQHITALNVIT